MSVNGNGAGRNGHEDGFVEFWGRAIKECREANHHLGNRQRPVDLYGTKISLWYCSHCGLPNDGKPISLNGYHAEKDMAEKGAEKDGVQYRQGASRERAVASE